MESKTVAYLIDCFVEPCLEFADVDVPDAAIPLVRRSDLEAAEASHKAARENFLTMQGSAAQLLGRAEAAQAHAAKLLHPFRNVDESDWHHLFTVLPDTTRGKFWKAVFTEARAALTESIE